MVLVYWGQDDGGWDRFLTIGHSQGSPFKWISLSHNMTGLTEKIGQGIIITESFYGDTDGGSTFYLDGALINTFTSNNNSGHSELVMDLFGIN